jgi:hypothetical protein
MGSQAQTPSRQIGGVYLPSFDTGGPKAIVIANSTAPIKSIMISPYSTPRRLLRRKPAPVPRCIDWCESRVLTPLLGVDPSVRCLLRRPRPTRHRAAVLADAEFHRVDVAGVSHIAEVGVRVRAPEGFHGFLDLRERLIGIRRGLDGFEAATLDAPGASAASLALQPATLATATDIQSLQNALCIDRHQSKLATEER